ncbi:MAG TPA: BON domain-containing protein [Methylomirabilota bacterium]
MKWRYAVIGVVCVLAFVGCRSMTGRSFGQQWDDKTITAQVKSKLTMDRFKNLMSTSVGTQFGVVHLTGNVADEAARVEAERIASRVPGVRQVKNDMVVVPRNGKAAQATTPAGATGSAGAPAASPGAGPMSISGQVTAIDRDTGDVTVQTDTGNVTIRLPSAALRDLEQGQRLSINRGQ